MEAAPAAGGQRGRGEVRESGRIPGPGSEGVQRLENKKELDFAEESCNIPVDVKPMWRMKPHYVVYNHFGYKEGFCRRIAVKKEYGFYNYCFVSVCLSFVLGLFLGVIIVGQRQPTAGAARGSLKLNSSREIRSRSLNSFKLTSNLKDLDLPEAEDPFATVSFTGAAASHKFKQDVYPKTLTEDMKEILKDNKNLPRRHVISSVLNKNDYIPNDATVLYDNVYWGPAVENSMPQGYGDSAVELWERYVGQSEVAGMGVGCGRMQNRLVTFRDGARACVRYRQNTDQIQGEIFSFYVARLLNLTNLAPSVVKVVDVKDKLWHTVAPDIAAAQWNANRAVVLTQYVPSLESATIPELFKPSTRHLNKYDVLKISMKESGAVGASKQILMHKIKTKDTKTANKHVADNFDHIDIKLDKKTIASFVELAQWSDLIVFDYLTANLDRIVNNLFNYQWNINIMDGPAHNLARKMDSGLLLFLDNESGLLHGYRLLKKYNVYHSLMLDNLCVFRKRTVDALRVLYEQSVGNKLSDIFHKKNNAVIRDILPPLPEKNAKILRERIGKILSQIDKCVQSFTNRSG